MIAYTDANHDVKRSQTGSVIQIGTNVITWKSHKQATISMSSAESEAQALASTEVLADFIKALRESTCVYTPGIELRCDNNAARVFTTGDGSWRTKSTANKVARVKEKIDVLKTVRVKYESTKTQHADSLTKFLRSSQEQQKALQHLSMEEITSDVQRISVSMVISMQCSGEHTRIRNHHLGVKNGKINLDSFSVATSAQYFANSCFTVLEMVRFVRPQCEDVTKLGEDDWSLPTQEDLLKEFPATEESIDKPIGPAEILSLVCKTDMIPLKDLNPLEFGDFVKYLPGDINMNALKNDKVKIDVPNPTGDEQRSY